MMIILIESLLCIIEYLYIFCLKICIFEFKYMLGNNYIDIMLKKFDIFCFFFVSFWEGEMWLMRCWVVFYSFMYNEK